MKRINLHFLFLISLFAFFGCKEKIEPSKETPMLLSYGLDSLTFKEYEPLSSKPVKLYYYIPDNGDVKAMPILFAMHGADRQGLYQIETWKDIAQDKSIMVFAPEFTISQYPEKDYQFGGVSYSTTTYSEKPEEEWTFNIIEAMFDYIKEMTGNKSEKYDLWGHSAGSQFSHRLSLFMKDARVSRVVISNAGFYTVPNPNGIIKDGKTYSYPYSTKGTNLSEDDLKSYFSKKIYVHIGTADTASTKAQDSYLPVTAGAKAQGKCRYERGIFFYNEAEEQAEKMGVPFNWTLVEVENVGHSSRSMVKKNVTGVAAILYNN